MIELNPEKDVNEPKPNLSSASSENFIMFENNDYDSDSDSDFDSDSDRSFV